MTSPDVNVDVKQQEIIKKTGSYILQLFIRTTLKT